MRLGFLTACLPTQSLSDIAAWAATAGYRGLEVAVWPGGPGREWEASHLDLDGFGTGRADDVRATFDQHGLEISALAYYENNLNADESAREATHAHLRRVIDAAATLDCGLVGTFVGRDVTKTVADNLDLAATVFAPLVDYAGERDVRLVVENCPMEGWHPDGYPANLAYSPELWEWMASIGLYLNWDPSHLQWLGIDPVEAITPYADQILHVQAKDTEVDAAARNRYGLFGRAVDRSNPWDSGWWRYRIPGLGDVDWRRVIDRLYQAGYDGFVSVEHEDPIWSGSPDKVRQGLTIAHRTLDPLLVD